MIKWELEYKPIGFHTHIGQEYCLYHPMHHVDGMVVAMDACTVEKRLILRDNALRDLASVGRPE